MLVIDVLVLRAVAFRLGGSLNISNLVRALKLSYRQRGKNRIESGVSGGVRVGRVRRFRILIFGGRSG